MDLISVKNEILQSIWNSVDSSNGKKGVVVAPGRINLIGEHTDYNGGKVLPFAIDKKIKFSYYRLPKEDISISELPEGHKIIIKSEGIDELFTTSWEEVAKIKEQVDKQSDATSYQSFIPENIAKSWASYMIGALYEMFITESASSLLLGSDEWLVVKVVSTLPQGAGISSSAALTTGLLSALSDAYSLPIQRKDIARKAMLIEHRFAGTNCGMMDQLAVLLSEKNSFLKVDFLNLNNDGTFETSTVKMHETFEDYELVGLNTCVKHSLSDSPYNERREACEKSVSVLNSYFNKNHTSLGGYSDDACLSEFRKDGLLCQEELKTFLAEKVLSEYKDSSVWAAYVAHGICENPRVDRACDALQSGDIERVSKLMVESHLSLQHDYKVSCDELNLIREEAIEVANSLMGETSPKPPIIGGRMTGGGFGGSVIQFVHKSILPKFIEHFTGENSRYFQTTKITPAILVTEASEGLSVLG